MRARKPTINRQECGPRGCKRGRPLVQLAAAALVLAAFAAWRLFIMPGG